MIKVNSFFIIAVLAASSLAAILVAFAALQPASSVTSISFEDDNARPKTNLDSNSRSTDQVNSILNAFNSSPQIRADILISAKRNDGTPIENKRFEEIRTELATQFGGVTVLPRFNGTSLRDGIRNDGTNNSGFFVVVESNAENIEWLIQYKLALKERLNQDRIFMTFSPTVISP
ncbi:MAG TPA: hypothetical protein VD736_10575 [Nitrososphaera sp.]|nr:hypothetical protein [Nitrososphaera sp.]